MITIDVEQGSEEWHAARAGLITASMFVEIRKKLKSGPNKGDYTTAAKDYAFRLAVERISGSSLDGGNFQTWAMRRGNELEPEARLLHEERLGMMIQHVGIVISEDRKFGASADGFIGQDGGSEYKCLVSPEKLRGVLLADDLSDYTDQIQGCMWLTGRTWWHYGLYCPALKSIGKELTIHKVDRDDNYIAEMEQDLLAFDAVVEGFRAQLEEVETGINPSIVSNAPSAEGMFS